MLIGSVLLRPSKQKAQEKLAHEVKPKTANQQIADEILLRLAAFQNDGKAPAAFAANQQGGEHANQQGPTVDDWLKGAQLSELDLEDSTKPEATPASAKEAAPTAVPSAPTAVATVAPEATPTPAATAIPATPTPVPTTAVKVEEKNPPKVEGAEKENALKNDLLAKLDERSRDLAHTEGEISRLSKENQELRATSAERDALRAEIQKNEEKIRELESEMLRREQRGGEAVRKLSENEKRALTLEKQLNEALGRAMAGEKESTQLRRAVQEFEKRVKLLEEQRLAEGAEKEQLLLKQLSSLRKDLAVAQGSLDELRIKSRQTSDELMEKSTALSNIRAQLETRQRQADECNLQLASSVRTNEKAKGMHSELLELKNQLLLAKEQIRALSSSSGASRIAAGPVVAPQQPQQVARVQAPSQRVVQEQVQRQLAQLQRTAPRVQPTAVPAPKNDTLTVEITVDKANLRVGPGEEHSAAMEVERGSRLMVEAKEGDWYRVYTPIGTRAYVRRDVVAELDANLRPQQPGTSPKRTVSAAHVDDDSVAVQPRARMRSKDALEDISDENRGSGGPANATDESQAFESLKKAFETAPENSN